MSDDTRQARIAAAMDAYRQWCDEHPVLPVFDVTRMYERHAGAMIAALDAADAAAPAVGVTVDAAALRRAAIVDFSIDLKPEQFDSPDEYWSVVTHIYYDRAERSIPLSDARTRRVITAYLDALLTAQPEPGTHDDAGQPAEGGVTG